MLYKGSTSVLFLSVAVSFMALLLLPLITLLCCTEEKDHKILWHPGSCWGERLGDVLPFFLNWHLRNTSPQREMLKVLIHWDKTEFAFSMLSRNFIWFHFLDSALPLKHLNKSLLTYTWKKGQGFLDLIEFLNSKPMEWWRILAIFTDQ